MAGHASAHPIKGSNLTTYLSLVNISMQKEIKEIDTLIPENLMIKESCNLIG